MTSAQSLRRRSNGNKSFWLSGLLLVLIFSSCGILVDTGRSNNPRTTQPARKPVKKTEPIRVDTIQWEETVIDIPEVQEDIPLKTIETEFKSSYTIALILPLDAKTPFEEVTRSTSDAGFRFLNYYGGVQLALEDLQIHDADIILEVMESGIRNNDALTFLRRLNEMDPDLIIGPYDRDLLKEVVRFGQRKEIPVVSPWQSSSKLTENNPYYLQLKPDIKRFYQAIVEHSDKRFAPDQVFLLGRAQNEAEQARVEYFQEFHLASADDPRPYKVYQVEEDSLSSGITAFDSLFYDTTVREIAVIIPNWSFRDEQFIYSCLRKLNAEKGETRVTVYGLPIMLDSEKIEYNLYKNLNLHIATDNYVNTHLEEVNRFRNRYFEKYHAFPADDALEGYDMMSYVGNNLVNHGTRFQYFLPESYQEFLQTAFVVVPVISDENLERENYDDVEYFENRFVRIVRFEYDGFVTSE